MSKPITLFEDYCPILSKCYWIIVNIVSEISESLDGDGVSVLTSFALSLLVLVSTSNKFPSLDESWSQQPRYFSPSMSLGLDIQEISQSWWVYVLTSKIFLSLDESRSRHPQIIKVLLGHFKPKKKESNQTWPTRGGWEKLQTNQSGIIEYWVHFMACRSFSFPLMGEAEISESLDGVSVSTSFVQSRYWDSDFFSLNLGLVIETYIFQSLSRHWD